MIQICHVSYDEESQEAEIALESNQVCVLCYFHPAGSIEHVYKSIKNDLLAYQVTDIMIENAPTPLALKTSDGYYSYFLRGKVISKSRIQIYDFVVDIGFIPNDIPIGAYVSCQCLRLDIVG